MRRHIKGVVLAFLGMVAMTASVAADEPEDRLVFAFNESPEAMERLKRATAELMEMTEQQMLAAVPAQAGIYFTDCPNCTNASNDRGNFDWSPRVPHRIVCRDCGESYPGNNKYPDHQTETVRAIGGEHIYPYYERSDGYRIYFRAHADYWARDYMAKRCMEMARLWWVTKDEQYARRAALILVRFAEVYPGYALHYDYPFLPKKIVPYDHGPIHEAMQHGDGVMRTAKWDWWAYMEISEELAAAYDLLRRWPPLGDMANGRAVQMIRHDLLQAMTDYAMGLEETYSNMSPHKWRAAVYTGRILGRPEAVHDTVRRLERFLDGPMMYDGSWMETSPSYMQQVAGMLSVMGTALSGYADPPAYTHPQTGRRLVAEDVAELLAQRRRILDHLDATRFPDGRLIPLNDTWSSDHRAPRSAMAAALSPGFGAAVLGGGVGDKQYHAYLNFTAGEQHKQCDALSIGLWAHGHELLSDIGYTHTAYRYWTMCTPSHNTVTVDGVDQVFDREHRGNRLRAFATDGAGFHLAEADAVGVYPQTSRYRRTLIAVGRDADEAYLVDAFQVHGGDQHDYILAGHADQDSTAARINLPLEPFTGTLLNAGVTFTKPVSENDLTRPATGLGFIRALRRAAANGPVVLDLRLAEIAGVGTRSWLDAESDAVVYLGEAPSIRRSQRRDATLDDFVMPMFIARRKGDGLHSTFVAVHEPVRGEPRILDVQVQRHESLIVMAVTHATGTDYVLIALDGPATAKIDTPHGRLQFEGRHALVRVTGDQAVEGHLVGGSRLSFGDVQLAGVGSYHGSVRGRDRRGAGDSRGGILVNEKIPADTSCAVLLLRYPDGTVQGYNVIGIEPVEGGSRIAVRESPGFDSTSAGVKLVYFPQREIQGTNVEYELLTAYHHAGRRQ